MANAGSVARRKPDKLAGVGRGYDARRVAEDSKSRFLDQSAFLFYALLPSELCAIATDLCTHEKLSLIAY